MRSITLSLTLIASAALAQDASFDAANKYLSEQSFSKACEGFEAFLKANPGTVLLDAMVTGEHKTLPGAYWAPELGAVTIGQKELDQIERTVRAANGGDLTRPIVVFERSSTYGWNGYHGVLRLLGMGYKNIYWYRGGLDAWHDAQFPLAQAQAWAKAR